MRASLYVLLGILLVPTVGLVGDIVTDGVFKSTVERGRPPLEVASPDMVVNLNADMVDGLEGTDLYTKAEVNALVAAAVESAKPRQFYLTNFTSQGADADDACGTSFHMASLWEISDPSNLRYAYDHVDASTAADSAQGMPTGWGGWIRTGSDSSSSTTIGFGNCNAWTSSSDSHSGTLAFISAAWVGSATRVVGTPWVAETFLCDQGHRVWCIQD